jgi:hypothetical protein
MYMLDTLPLELMLYAQDVQSCDIAPAPRPYGAFCSARIAVFSDLISWNACPSSSYIIEPSFTIPAHLSTSSEVPLISTLAWGELARAVRLHRRQALPCPTTTRLRHDMAIRRIIAIMPGSIGNLVMVSFSVAAVVMSRCGSGKSVRLLKFTYKLTNLPKTPRER